MLQNDSGGSSVVGKRHCLKYSDNVVVAHLRLDVGMLMDRASLVQNGEFDLMLQKIFIDSDFIEIIFFGCIKIREVRGIIGCFSLP